jgi:hypothetical protein
MTFFTHSTVIPAPVQTVFAFHESARALERLLPPWQDVRVVRKQGGLEPGSRVELELRLGPLRQAWVARHTGYQRDVFFSDIQEKGPFRIWNHRHEFAPAGPAACRLTDRIEFSLPGGTLIDWLAGWAVKLQLRRMFAYRHAATLAACLESA